LAPLVFKKTELGKPEMLMKKWEVR
jgi:hypothetical protein